MKHLIHPNSQKVTIEKLTETSATLVLPDGQKITWDRQLLPEGCKEQDTISLIVHSKETDTQEREKLAKQILNELFKSPTK